MSVRCAQKQDPLSFTRPAMAAPRQPGSEQSHRSVSDSISYHFSPLLACRQRSEAVHSNVIERINNTANELQPSHHNGSASNFIKETCKKSPQTSSTTSPRPVASKFTSPPYVSPMHASSHGAISGCPIATQGDTSSQSNGAVKSASVHRTLIVDPAKANPQRTRPNTRKSKLIQIRLRLPFLSCCSVRSTVLNAADSQWPYTRVGFVGFPSHPQTAWPGRLSMCGRCGG